MKNNNITIIGLGPMGQAFARAYLQNGYAVTVWNRTPAKAVALAAEGATVAKNIEDAIAASQVIIISLTDYDAFYKVLEPAAKALQNKVLVNLSSDAPSVVRKAAAWAARYGAEFLAGGVMVPPPLVAQPGAYVFYSGNQQVFELHRSMLEIIGRPDFLGNDPGLALLYYQALLDIMFFCLTGVVHAIAMIRSADIKAERFEPYVQQFLPLIPQLVQGIGQDIDTKKYYGEDNNMRMLTASISHVVQASKDAGIDTTTPGAIYDIFKKAVDKRFEKQGYTSIIEIIENQ
jgi:3-hydroxyisobutyrate dehydrogenase-like beta-hydroxyacid dehydrogenase